MTAAIKNRPGLSLGNIVGSNVFDCLVPVGVASCIAPLRFDGAILRFDLPFLMLMSVTFSILLARKAGLQRGEGCVLCALYLVYLIAKVVMH